MLSHIFVDVEFYFLCEKRAIYIIRIARPTEYLFEKILSCDRFHVFRFIARFRVNVIFVALFSDYGVHRQSVGSREVFLRVRYPTAVVVCISQFLFGEFYACDVDSTEPFHLRDVISFANERHQFVIVEFFSANCQRIVSEFSRITVDFRNLDRELSFNELANRSYSLLPVDDFQSSVIEFCEINNVQRATFENCRDNCVSARLFINELSLVGRGYVE